MTTRRISPPLSGRIFAFFGVRLLVTRKESVREEIRPSNRRVAMSAFAMVTAAEWGDASQIGTAALVAHLHAPFQVVMGATAGLWLGTLLAVGVGRLVGGRLPAHWLRVCAGVLFCAFAALTVLEIR